MIELAPGITGSGMPSGGATISGSNSNDSFELEQAYQINAVGQRQDANEYDVDGSSLNSASRDGVVNLAPEPDTIDSVRVSSACFLQTRCVLKPGRETHTLARHLRGRANLSTLQLESCCWVSAQFPCSSCDASLEHGPNFGSMSGQTLIFCVA
jgi:hypothetical protein